MTRLFLSHTWRPDGLGRNTHGRVANVNDELAERGVQTWFDEEVGMSHDIDSCMAEGIEECDVFVVFVTCAYCKKVERAARDPCSRDNCYKEFSYAQCLNKLMLPVVFEPNVLDEWPRGIVKMNCANKMYVDGSIQTAGDVAKEIMKLSKRLCRRSNPPPPVFRDCLPSSENGEQVRENKESVTTRTPRVCLPPIRR